MYQCPEGHHRSKILILLMHVHTYTHAHTKSNYSIGRNITHIHTNRQVHVILYDASMILYDTSLNPDLKPKKLKGVAHLVL